MPSNGYKLLKKDSPCNSSSKSHFSPFTYLKNTGYLQARYVLTFWSFWGFFIVYALRVNLSVAIVSMVNNTAMVLETHNSVECPNQLEANLTYIEEKEGEFSWDEKTQGIILAAFFYGYIVTQIPGGWLAELFGGKWLMGGGILCTALFTLLTPFAARWSVPAFVITRIIAGLGEGVTFPAYFILIAKWSPVQERSTLMAITMNGANVGTVFTIPIAALLCERGFAGGWPSVFYVFGLFGCLWFVCWMFLVYDAPELHPRISKEELHWITKNRESCAFQKRLHNVPWKSILTSGPVWALAVSKLSIAFGFYTLLTELPNYMNVMLHVPIEKNGYENSLLYVASSITTIVAGVSADYFRSNNYASTSIIRKSYQAIAAVGSCICFAIVPWLGCNPSSVICILVLCMAILGFTAGGESPLAVDLAPDYAGTVGGITNGFGNLAGIFAPMLVGFVTQHNETMLAWGTVFYFASFVTFIGGLVFVIFGSADPQSWAVTEDISLCNLVAKTSEDEQDENQEETSCL